MKAHHAQGGRPTYRYKRKNTTASNKEAITKIGGCMLLLMLIILFVAAHGRNNEMMYVTLLFVFLAVTIFSYAYWSAVCKGESLRRYINKTSTSRSDNIHMTSSAPDYKGHPKSRVHVVAPPKMGGVRLEIYTLPDDTSSTSNVSEHSHTTHHHHHHHHNHSHPLHQLYHHHHTQLRLKNNLEAATPPPSPQECEKADNTQETSQVDESCIDLSPLDPIHCEVNLCRSASQRLRQSQRKDFVEVELPPLKK